MADERIRTEGAVPNTIHNLIQTLSVKLDSAARYGLYQDDARKDGYDDCASAFARLAEQERGAIEQLVNCLQQHIGQVAQQQGSGQS